VSKRIVGRASNRVGLLIGHMASIAAQGPRNPIEATRASIRARDSNRENTVLLFICNTRLPWGGLRRPGICLRD
jgi:hypothetical protein